MAKLMMPQGSTEARGRVGGLVHNDWRGISYVKAASSPSQPRSARQLQVRAYTTRLVRYWATTLSAIERGWWNDYAVTHPDIDWTGNSKRLTGLNWFVRCTLRLLDMGRPIAESPPATAAPDPIVSYQALNGVLSSQQIWQLGPGTDLQVDLWRQGPHSVGAIAKIERAKHDSYTAYEVDSLTVSNLAPGRHTFFARIISEANGLASPWLQDFADVSAT